MLPRQDLTFVVPVNSSLVFETNFLASPALRQLNVDGAKPAILVKQGYNSAAGAYNAAIDESKTDLLVFVHQDLYLPEFWMEQLQEAIAYLDSHDSTWGVAGCWGVRADGSFSGHVYSTGLGILGQPAPTPVEIQTLDEIVLVLRRSSGVRFDERIHGFHFYGSALCMKSRALGRKCYAIAAFCIHNTKPLPILPVDFYRAYWEFRRVWKAHLPIQTTCIRVTWDNKAVWERRLRELYLRVSGRSTPPKRPSDPEEIMQKCVAKMCP